jgi:uncharacterized protein YecE (DUF72 family)
MKLHIGTSGYNYAGWLGSFYPGKLSAKGMLDFYMGHFNTVEINYSFYHTPRESTMRKWRDAAAGDFKYSLKVPRQITHTRRLHESSDLIENFNSLSLILGNRCGVLLYQMPPSFNLTCENIERLESVFRLNNNNLSYAVEFRHNSWFDSADTADLCARFGTALCIVSAPGIRFLNKATGKVVYIRLHGIKSWYNYDYSKEELKDFSCIINEHLRNKREVWVYFNNDAGGFAVKNALELKGMM